MPFLFAGLFGPLLLPKLGAFGFFASLELTESGRRQTGPAPPDAGSEKSDLAVTLAEHAHRRGVIDVPHAKMCHRPAGE
jgi:hypothetical protein